MFCGTCGMEINDGSTICPRCGANLASVNQGPSFNGNYEGQPQNNNSKGKLIAIIAACGVVVVAAVVAVVFMALGSNGYEKRVENCLDFYATQETDVEKFLTDGNTGNLSTDDAIEAYTIAFNTMLDDEDNKSYYGESMDYDSYEEYMEDNIDRMYDKMEDTYGDWELTYEIKSSKEVSKKELKEINKNFEEGLEDLEEAWEEYDFSSDDEEIIEEFFDNLSDVEIEEAYTVKVKVKIDGDDASLKETYEFVVANVDGDWVITSGPNLYAFIYDAESEDSDEETEEVEIIYEEEYVYGD